MSARFFRSAVVASGILCASVASTSQAEVIYRETFGRPDPATGNITTNNFDWARYNADGTIATNNGGVSSDGVGKPTDLANTTSAGPNVDSTFNAYAEGWSYQDGTQRLTMSPEFAVNPANYENGSISFSWYQGAAQIAGVDQQIKLAVRVGGQWFASVGSTTNLPVTSGANFGSTDPTVAQGGTQVSMAYNPAAANWLTLNFNGDYDTVTNTPTASTLGAFALGAAPVSDLVGEITAFGLYRDATGANLRFDTFQIDATPIPEPTAVAGLLLGSVALLGRKRRSA
jgi:hypothetical protein